MENPATWKQAELVVSEALDEGAQLAGDGMGLSIPRYICDRLRSQGYILDDEESEIGWKGFTAWLATRRQEPSEPGPMTPVPGGHRSRT
jgi:hypothetical protein